MKKRVANSFLQNLTFSTFILNISILLVYIISGKIGLSLAFINPSATAIWPPTGIALACLLFFGNRVAPAIFLGAFIVNLTTAGTPATSIFIALGNTFEGVVGAYLVKRYANGIHAFSNVLDIFKFILLAAILSTTISANVGVLTLIVGNLASWKSFIQIWTTWWLGDMSGDLIIAPLFLIWGAAKWIQYDFKNTLNLLLSFFVLFITTDFVFIGLFPYPYLCIPVTVWIAFWFGRRGATVATLTIAIIAIFYTLHGIGPFAKNVSINQALILLQLFLGILSITSITFAALIHTIRKGEKTLATHEARFQALIEKSFDAVFLIDATSRILYASPSVKRVLGYDPKDLIGFTGFDLVIPDDRTYAVKTLANLILKPGNTITIEFRVSRKDKKIIWVEVTGTNLLFDQSINAVVVNFRDITDKKILEENILREKTVDEAMLASIGDGILATDYTGKISMVNRAACETFNCKKTDLIGKTVTDTIPMEDETGKIIPVIDRPITKVLKQRRKIVTSQTYYYVRKDKSKFPVRFTVTPITINGKISGIIEVFHDITKEKEIDQMKDEFISMASHELRTPMTAVNGLLSMISHGDYGTVNEKLKHPLENIQISAQRQIHLINDLLNVSRLQSGKIEFTITNFPLRQVLEDIVKSLMPIAQQKKLKLTFENNGELLVHADEEWCKNILNNLIGNALKFTENGGVSISYHAKNEFVFVSVTDTGSGINSDDRDKLFGKFKQLDGQTSGKPPGSGLGLYLSRELAQKMGGDVQLQKSTVGAGSTFILMLPKAQTNSLLSSHEKHEDNKKIAFSPRTR
ncbi:MAG TPA: MASE1 domain-containing protein [Candidatus Acidoferrales bacterium]|nr:MASE1 domain-containing protein [Candidatus Acidoferrales bacterium]